MKTSISAVMRHPILMVRRLYLITRPEGNILVDSPRYAKTLVRRIEEMGGISTLWFSHRDDVADHQKFHEHFGCKRIIHRADASGIPAEQFLEGEDPVSLDNDLIAIPVPGHTRGHVVLLYRNKFLFTGDHLAWSDNRGGLIAFRSVRVVLLARTDKIHETPARLPFRVGATRPRPPSSSIPGRHASEPH
jgi:glyoxylase-like metal-dependent hydrolase (beta-lactamase superfamily II)